LLGLDSATMTGLIDRAEAKEYVKRRADPSDRRVNHVVLTKTGRDLEEPVTLAMNQFDSKLAALVDGDIDSFNQGLVRMGKLS
jgi:DNA-binding MarR family transcriptional regulator